MSGTTSDLKRDGEAAVEWVRRSIRRAAVLQGVARGIAVTEAVRRFVAVRPVLEKFANYERTVRNMHESSTQLRDLVGVLARLDARVPDTRPSDAERDAALADAHAPFDPLAALREHSFQAEFLGIRGAPTWEPHAVVRLHDGTRGWSLHVWEPWRFDGPLFLSHATVGPTEHGVVLSGAEGALRLNGPVTVVPGAADAASFDRSPALEPAETEAWPALVALVDRVNARARWDYELDDDPEPFALALRGTSGAYEHGCRLTCVGVFAANLPSRFSHAVFSLLHPAEIPLDLAPPHPGWIALGIEGDAGASDARRSVVVCRGLRFEDDDAAPVAFQVGGSPRREAAPPPRPLVEVALAERDDVRAAVAALAGIPAPDKTPEGRALWALRESWPRVDGPPDASRQLSHVAHALVRVLDFRAALGPRANDRVVDTFAPAARRAAQRRVAADLLRLASSVAAEHDLDPAATWSLDTDGWELTAPDPSERLLVEARALVVREIVRREFGLPPQGVALDLDRQTVGRVLADPVADGDLPEAEKLARAAELVVLDPAKQGAPVGLDVLLPDARQRARVLAMAPVVRSRLGALEPLAQALSRAGELDRREFSLLLEGQYESHDWYVLLRALLQGHRAFPST